MGSQSGLGCVLERKSDSVDYLAESFIAAFGNGEMQLRMFLKRNGCFWQASVEKRRNAVMLPTVRKILGLDSI